MPDFYTVKDATRRTQLCARTFIRLRVSGAGPPYVRVGTKVLYPVVPFEEWFKARTFKHRAEEAAARAHARRAEEDGVNQPIT